MSFSEAVGRDCGFSSLLLAVGLGLVTLLAQGSSWTSWAGLLLCLTAVKLFVSASASKSKLEPRVQPGVTDLPGAQQKGYEDPLRWSFLPSQGAHLANTAQPEEYENELCSVKCLAMHRPTHEPWRETTKDYPYSWHLGGRKRFWEIRLQLRFKRVPSSKLFFGLELEDYEPASATGRHMKTVLMKAVQRVVGDFYYADGDDPSEINNGDEPEPPTFVMPLWAFDQFIVSEVGQEPDITGDLEGVGIRRTDGLKSYIRELKAATDNLSTSKVYTFCIWGVSQFLDCMNWEVRGILPGMRFGFSSFGLRPPVKIVIYEIPEQHADPRHLVSRKRYYLQVAMWSMLHPPTPERLRRLLGSFADAKSATLPKKYSFSGALDFFGCCVGTSRREHDESTLYIDKVPDVAFGG